MNDSHRLNLIRERLNEALKPSYLDIRDQSHHHIGHPGAQSGGGHFDVYIASEVFVGKSLVACHQMIYGALGELMGREIHALSIKIKNS